MGRAVRAYTHGGLAAVLPMFAPDVLAIADRTYRGHDGLRELDGAWAAGFDKRTLRTLESGATEDWVMVIAEIAELGADSHGGAGDPAPRRHVVGMVASRFDQGKIDEVRFFGSYEETYKALGMRAG